VRGSLSSAREESSVARAATVGGDAHAVDDLKLIVLGVDDEKGVGPEVIDDEEPAGGVEDGLVGVGGLLTVGIGAERVVGGNLLEEAEGAVGDVPDVNCSGAAVERFRLAFRFFGEWEGEGSGGEVNNLQGGADKSRLV